MGTSDTFWRRFIQGKNPKRTWIRVGIWICSSLLVFRFILVPVRVTGISMLPSYRDRQINFANRLTYRFREPRRGDVVVILTTGRSITYLKRIVGLPGEEISISNNIVYVEGKPMVEPYARLNLVRPWNRPPVRLMENEFLVIGDNRTMDQRLHEFGEVQRWRLFGKVLY